MIYHLATTADWDAARARPDGEYRVSTLGRTLEEEGFIHCSFEHQVDATAAAYFVGRDDVVRLTIDPERVPSEIKIEGGFPHIYGPLPVAAVVAVDPA